MQAGQPENAHAALGVAHGLIGERHLVRPLLALLSLKGFVQGLEPLEHYAPMQAAQELLTCWREKSLSASHWQALSLFAPEVLDLLTRLYPLELSLAWTDLLLRVSDLGAQVSGLPLPYYPSGMEMVWGCLEAGTPLYGTLRQRLSRHRLSVQVESASVVWMWQVTAALRRLSPPSPQGVARLGRTTIH